MVARVTWRPESMHLFIKPILCGVFLWFLALLTETARESKYEGGKQR
jgi:hypothetical protein